MTLAGEQPEASAYARDGVVVVRGLVGSEWLARLRAVADRICCGSRSLMAINGEALPDSYLWLTEEEVRDFLIASSIPDLVGQLMSSRSVRLFYDQLFVKVPQASEATPWHQDAAHWCLAGDRVCSVWLALDDTGPEDGGLRYIAGSQAEGPLYRPVSRVRPEAWLGTDGAPPEDFEAPRFRARERSFTLAAGDAVVHHAKTLHASHPNRSGRHARRGYVTRWLGDDVVYRDRGFTMPLPMAVPLVDGAPLEHPLFPSFGCK